MTDLSFGTTNEKLNENTNENPEDNSYESSSDTSTDFLSDVHVHLQDRRFGTDLSLVFNRAKQQQVNRFLCSATVPGDWTTVQKIAREHENVIVTYGIHPWFLEGISGDWETWLSNLLDDLSGKSPYLPGVGELGLDFAMKNKNIALQENFLHCQLKLANDKKRPIVLHTVHAVDRVLALIKDYSDIPFCLFHGFIGTVQQIEQIVDRGGFFSFSFRNVHKDNESARATIRQIPRDRILLESDGPSLIPSREVFGTERPVRIIMRHETGKDGFILHEPALIPMTLQEMAPIKNMTPEELRAQIQLNEKRFFYSWPKK